MTYDFEVEPRVRRGSGSVKWDQYEDPHSLIPMWVADMDFPLPRPITAAIEKRLKHPYLGYTQATLKIKEVMMAYFESEHNCPVAAEHFLWTPGIIPLVKASILALSNQGDSVMFCTPAYPPFFNCVNFAKRELIHVPLVLDTGRYTFDIESMEEAVQHSTRIFILNNPHNPTGRVFTRGELEKVAAFCQKHQLIIISDEIHCDIVYKPYKHLNFLAAFSELKDSIILATAPTKAFNLAGLACSHNVIANAEIREAVAFAAKGLFVNALGYQACMACYTECQEWRQACMAYLDGNRRYLHGFVEEQLPEIGLLKQEATYMAWLNFQKMEAIGMTNPYSCLIEHGVRTLPGSDFGQASFQRINFGCPRACLETGMQRILKAVKTFR